MLFETIKTIQRPWIQTLLAQIPKRPLLIGIQGPQGIGKTTLAQKLIHTLSSAGTASATLSILSISIDDFYLTHEEQLRLANQHPTLPYWQKRGYPGTHDINLGVSVLTELCSKKSGLVKIPRYDKSLFNGEGDRLPESQWTETSTLVDLILFDGWMLGFSPIIETEKLDSSLKTINKALATYAPWKAFIDAWIVLHTDSFENIVNWRSEAEEKMKQHRGSGMSTQAIQNYVRSFFPAYKLYLNHVLTSSEILSKPHLFFGIDKNRSLKRLHP